MARKKASELTHPGRSHPTFTAEEAKDRERQRQRDKRARRKLERSTRPVPLDTENANSSISQKGPILGDEYYSKFRDYIIYLFRLPIGEQGTLTYARLNRQTVRQGSSIFQTSVSQYRHLER